MVYSKIRIMIVEDEGLIAMDIKNNLIQMGYEVTAIVDNHIDAIAEAEKNKPNLTLMDIYIKGSVNGIETAKQLKETFNIPSLFITAYNDLETSQKISKISSLGILNKPFDDSEFQTKMLDLKICEN